MSITGKFYNGVLSKQYDAELFVDSAVISIRLPNDNGEPLPDPTPLRKMNISSRLDRVPRSLRFPTGQQFLTENNNAIDDLLESSGLKMASTLAHRLESYLPLVVLSLICIASSGFGFVKYGVPVIANRAAELVPESVQISMGKSVLDQFSESGYFGESLIAGEERDRYRSYFKSFNHPDDAATILFRDSTIFGPNAFALPGGTIVFTDKLVGLATRDEELLAIYFHELGHVKHKHMVKQVLQSSLLTLFFVSLTGDLAAATDLVTAIPAVLLSLNYSRKFETEADQFALTRLEQADIDAAHFANIMRKLLHQSIDSSTFFLSTEYISTHPAPDQRLAYIDSHSTLPEIINDLNAKVRSDSEDFKNADRFEGQWSVSMFPTDDTSPDGAECVYGEGVFFVSNGEINGTAISNFKDQYSFTGKVDADGQNFWSGKLTNAQSLSFKGDFLRESGTGTWQTVDPTTRQSVASCSGTWAANRKDIKS